MSEIEYSCQLDEQQGLWWCKVHVSSNFKCADTVFDSLRTTITGAKWQTWDQTFHSGWVIGNKLWSNFDIDTSVTYSTLYLLPARKPTDVIWKGKTEVVFEVKTAPLSLHPLHLGPVHVGYVVDEVALGQASQGTSVFQRQYHFLSNS